jgi:lipopolysaccharide transport system ATP-binding protein
MTVIEVKNLAKTYRLGTYTNATTLAERFGELFGQRAETAGGARIVKGILWALRDVSFSVTEGEVVGILGPNGSGKSTLLKILSRITPPTDGFAKISGRMASLLEVGAGFHPELTGRENVFLNGVILGMSREMIKKRFDEIVHFADVVPFIDTPVKRYSSGMYVRLAFAVAAHLDSEILLVDEVLAVGDAAFQRKCLGKLSELTTQGRTVLFVSHNLQAVRSFCSRVVVLDNGVVVDDGPRDRALPAYAKLMQGPRSLAGASLANRLQRSSGKVRLTGINAREEGGRESWSFRPGSTIQLELAYQVKETVDNLALFVALRALNTGETLTTFKEELSSIRLDPGSHATVLVQFPHAPLRPGEYSFTLGLGDQRLDKWHDILDENVNLPYLTILPSEIDPKLEAGYFSIPATVAVRAT